MNTIKRVLKEEEFQRNSELKEEDVQHLKDWCGKQPHLPKKIYDSDLILFLHSNYYQLEATKKTIENYFTCRTHVPEFFSNRDPINSKEIRMAMSTFLAIPLEEKTNEGYNVIYSRLIDLDPDKFNINDLFRLYNMIFDLYLTKSGTSKGFVLVSDMKGVQMSHALRIPPMTMKKYLYYLQEAMPIRMKGLHFLNSNAVMDFIFGLMKPFLKKELVEVLFMHSTWESAEKHLPMNILPNEAGGTAGSMMDHYSKILKMVEDHQNFFNEEEQYMRVDETQRVGKAKSATDIFGIDGSFKKLDID